VCELANLVEAMMAIRDIVRMPPFHVEKTE
jgi:hypothetical protein